MQKRHALLLLLTLGLVACGPQETTTPVGPIATSVPTPGPSVSTAPDVSPEPEASIQPSATPTPKASIAPIASSTPESTPEPTPLPTALPEKTSNKFNMNFVRIPAGTYTQGSPSDEPGRDSDETQRQVTLTKDFLIQTTEVTQGQWKEVMGNNPATYQEPFDLARPIESVSFDEVLAFIEKLNELTKQTYRLPTEAEWEYAARAGSKSTYSFGVNPRFLDTYDWYIKNISDPESTHPVAQKTPNAWGLYDVHGNVAEFVKDFYAAARESGEVIDPKGPPNSSLRLYKGGSFKGSDADVRLAARVLLRPITPEGHVGFRLVLD